ncbi:oxygenase MpaB family protein [Stakelama tenebrarum]|uniref:DUF2236 domain-containing protein n=1 Tax=Stakelama tenebrarum TaxID=2711215 RepID=A0A6G6Y0P4_9SPHN|nr:oxygenase MpaB family protein [Sphingosinithalassobacter tenebrarum]QIG78377.1 DUF2236 domain-containing protein [Sphingosinithalassobacter tenebrarum]
MSAADALRRAMIGEVRSFFHDTARGDAPVIRSDDALLPRDCVAWRVHGDVMGMMIGGVSALLLQMLHPAALAGVWDFSNFREDMHGRLRRTARFIALTTYAQRDDAEAAIARVKAIHAQVQGTLPDGTPYRADDPHLLAWVHAAESLSFLAAWRRYGEPGMSRADQDRYFAETAYVAHALGADPVPATRAEAQALLERYRPELRADARSAEVAKLVLRQPPQKLALAPVQSLVMQAAVDLLPPWAREMHGLRVPRVAQPAFRGAARGIAGTLRWAFRG